MAGEADKLLITPDKPALISLGKDTIYATRPSFERREDKWVGSLETPLPRLFTDAEGNDINIEGFPTTITPIPLKARIPLALNADGRLAAEGDLVGVNWQTYWRPDRRMVRFVGADGFEIALVDCDVISPKDLIKYIHPEIGVDSVSIPTQALQSLLPINRLSRYARRKGVVPVVGVAYFLNGNQVDLIFEHIDHLIKRNIPPEITSALTKLQAFHKSLPTIHGLPFVHQQIHQALTESLTQIHDTSNTLRERGGQYDDLPIEVSWVDKKTSADLYAQLTQKVREIQQAITKMKIKHIQESGAAGIESEEDYAVQNPEIARLNLELTYYSQRAIAVSLIGDLDAYFKEQGIPQGTIQSLADISPEQWGKIDQAQATTRVIVTVGQILDEFPRLAYVHHKYAADLAYKAQAMQQVADTQPDNY